MVTAADGAAAYQRALAADVRARQVTGRQLLHNSHIEAAAPARAELAGGRVDARLLITLAALAHDAQVHIVAFGGGNPAASPGIPLRTVDLTSPAGTDAAAFLDRARQFLIAQRPPYLASSITMARLADGRNVLHVGYAAPSPLGLLGAPAPEVHRTVHNKQSPHPSKSAAKK
jgi:hypothetical protein